jgi:hypothetical protein
MGRVDHDGVLLEICWWESPGRRVGVVPDDGVAPDVDAAADRRA